MPPLKKFSEFVATCRWAQPTTPWTIHLPKQCLLLYLCIVAIVGRRKEDVIGTNQLSIKAEYKCLQLFYVSFFFHEFMKVLAWGPDGPETVCLIRQPFLMPASSTRKNHLSTFVPLQFSSPLPSSSPIANPPIPLSLLPRSSHYFHTRTATATSSHRTSRFSQIQQPI